MKYYIETTIDVQVNSTNTAFCHEECRFLKMEVEHRNHLWKCYLFDCELSSLLSMYDKKDNCILRCNQCIQQTGRLDGESISRNGIVSGKYVLDNLDIYM